MSDKERDSIQEMEDIQKGLEAFLQQEMQEMQASGAGARRSTGRPAANAGTHSAEREAARPAPQMENCSFASFNCSACSRFIISRRWRIRDRI